jgi:hypothetical protein
MIPSVTQANQIWLNKATKHRGGAIRMDLARIVSELKRERDRIDRAITALDGGDSKGLKADTSNSSVKSGGPKRGKRLSAEGRRRISEAMKRRWAAKKSKAGKQAAKKTA